MSTDSWQPPLAMRSLRYVYIPMRDGKRLACDIYRPSAEGKYPCIMVRTPYNKNNRSAKDADPWVRRGYVFCVVDARGTGASEGDFAFFNQPQHSGDGADVVNWLARKDFCNGKIGTLGGSALGMYQLLTAREKPKALKAMYVEVAPNNPYQDNWFPGGVCRLSSRIIWLEGMTPRVGPAMPLEDVDGEIDPEGDIIRREVSLHRMCLRDQRISDGKSVTPQDWAIPLRQAEEYGPIWEERNFKHAISECDIPTCYRGIWYDHFIRSTCESYQLHRGPKLMLVNPGDQGVHGLHSDIDILQDQIRWFDYWLKDINNGVMDIPSVRLFVMGAEQWQGFDNWPPEGRKHILALSAGGELLPPDQAQEFEDAYEHDPADPVISVDDIQDIRDFESRAILYTSKPLTENLRVIGSPVVRLSLRCSEPDTHVFVKLADVFTDGRSRQIGFGRLRAAHRDGHDKVTPIPAGETVELTIPLWPTANTFLAGHRIRLVITASDAPYSGIYPNKSRCAIVGVENAPPTIELPVVD